MLRLKDAINVLLLTCAIVLGDQTITCSSNKGAYTKCSLRGSYDTIVKTELHSRSPCIKDVSYGLTQDFIWVTDGCRATFLVTNTGTTTTTTTTTPPTTKTTSTTTTPTTATTAPTMPISTALAVQTSNAIPTFPIPSTRTTSSPVTTAISTVPTEMTTVVLTVSTNPLTNTASLYNTTSHSGLCECNCTVKVSTQTIDSIIQELRKTLAVNKSFLSSTTRKKTSASDPRMSAAVIGYSGVIFLVVVAMIVVSLDLISLSRFISRKYK